MNARLIGIDCATEDSRIGIALARFDNGHVIVEDAHLCGPAIRATDVITRWITDTTDRCLLAIDAPLGWPFPLAHSLSTHLAGEELAYSSNELFRRTTDQFIYETIGKRSLDIGADRIARTAHSALRILGEVRRRTGEPVPLAWSPGFTERVTAIEVYPAATLHSRRWRSGGYKEKSQRSERNELIQHLEDELSLAVDSSRLAESADVLDACVCILAAKDFLEHRALQPLNMECAKKEGWIWTASPQR
jgi:hypothetical protein